MLINHEIWNAGVSEKNDSEFGWISLNHKTLPIKYKVIARGQPGVKGGGIKKYYASANISDVQILSDLTSTTEQMNTVSGADILAVLYSLVQVMQIALKDGQIVRLGELGSLRISISSKGMNSPKEVNSASIKSASVIFTPSKTLRKIIPQLTYEKM